MKTLYIFHPKLNFLNVDPLSTLITDGTKPLTQERYHTSLGDISAAEVIKIYKYFDKIIFVNELFDLDSSIFKETVCLLSHLSHFIPVENFTVETQKTFTNVDVSTRPDSSVLWIFGCSHSHGVGLDDPNQRYGSILGNFLNMPVIHVTQPGSSTRWSLRHLINANILPGDIVVWQLTSPERLSLVEDSKIKEYLLANVKNKHFVMSMTDEQIMFDHLSLVNYGVRYLRSLKANFVLTSMLNSTQLYYDCQLEYTKIKEYCYVPNVNLDLGHDNVHYGPKSHKNLAIKLKDHLKKLTTNKQ